MAAASAPTKASPAPVLSTVATRSPATSQMRISPSIAGAAVATDSAAATTVSGREPASSSSHGSAFSASVAARVSATAETTGRVEEPPRPEPTRSMTNTPAAPSVTMTAFRTPGPAEPSSISWRARMATSWPASVRRPVRLASVWRSVSNSFRLGVMMSASARTERSSPSAGAGLRIVVPPDACAQTRASRTTWSGTSLQTTTTSPVSRPRRARHSLT